MTEGGLTSSVKKGGLIFALTWSLLLSLLVMLPHVIAFATTPPGSDYLLTAYPSAGDTNAYFSWIRQAADGDLLFNLKYTSEPTPPWIFHPVFLVMGLLVRFGLPLPVVWFGTQVVSIIFLVFPLYLFLRLFSLSQRARNFLLCLTTLAGGFGWIFLRLNFTPPFSWRPVDITLAEATIGRSIAWPFIFSLAIGLLLLAFVSIVRYDRSKRLRDISLAAAAAFLLVLIHPYDAVTLAAVGSLFLVIRQKIGVGKPLAILAAAVVLPVAYYLLLNTDPALAATSRAEMRSPSILAYLLGFGFLIPLALAGLVLFLNNRQWRSQPAWVLAVVWLAVVPLLVYAPVSFQRRLIEGYVVPLSLFSFIGLKSLADWLSRYTIFSSQRIRNFLAVCVIGVVALSPLMLIKNDIKHVRTYAFPYYLTDQQSAALAWLRNHTLRSDVVLSSADFGSVIPRFSGNTVYIGHWAQTLDFDAKEERMQSFYRGTLSPDERVALLRGNNIAYVIFGTEERKIGAAKFLQNEPLFERAYSSGETVIYRVQSNS